ncbi:hypothetical protein [Bradyrhizobium sp.]|uniref:hypothetical protein n=1 Tax=Bradyrhizobium sp. TaxID=376 RepID=UPI003C32DB89
MSALNRHVDKAGSDLSAFRRNAPVPAQGPMSQQASFGSHGYDMHPQTFVRLVGYQTSEAAEHQAAFYERAQPKAAA